MKLRWILPIIMVVWICMTGCGDRRDMTIQQDEMPVVPAVTTFVSQTDLHTADETGTTAVIRTQNTASVQTDAGKGSTTRTVTGTAEAAAADRANSSASGNSGGGQSGNVLYGKWETVSFAKDSGSSVSYDLSDPVHRSYYVGLDLNGDGQSALTVGAESHPATVSFSGRTVEVCTVNRDNPVRMVFTVSADWNLMTVELLNGRILATLKRVQTGFSIRDFLTYPSLTDVKVLADAWYYQEMDPQDRKTYKTVAFVTIWDDGSYTYQPTDGAVLSKGTVQQEYEAHPDGSRTPLFRFCDEDGGTGRFSISCETESKDVYSVGNGGMARLIRKKPDEGAYDHYVGTWLYDRCTIRIAAQDNGYLVRIVWSDSAAEYREWTYLCSGSDDGTYLECTGGGTLMQIESAEGGTETRTVVYNDGTAQFSIRGGVLRWQGEKEGKGDQVFFTPAGE